MIDLDSADERLAAAGEYVVGTLADDDHASFDARLARDPQLLAAVYAWQDRLLGLTAHSDAVEPSAALWQGIERDIGTPASTAPRPTGAERIPMPWWRRLAPWQGISALALAASLFLAILLVQGGRPGASAETRYLAVLQRPDDRTTGWVVEISAGRTVRLSPVAGAIAPPAGRVLQFWTKPQGAEAPTSLGLVTAGRALELPVARLPGLGAQQLFEITLEPEGGSPIGRPTGPILYVGRTVQL